MLIDSNQNGVKPGFVLTSMVKRVDNAVYDVVRDVRDQKFEGGFHTFGLEKDLMACHIGKLDDFVFDGGAIPRSGALNSAGIKSRFLEVLPDDFVGLPCGISDPTGHLFHMERLRIETENIIGSGKWER